jgi:uncharacterized LabA/DUF88 family protein
MGKVAVFIDAGYFWVQAVHLLRGTKGPREGIRVDYGRLHQDVLELVTAQFPQDELLRVYWYDGPGPAGAKADSHLEVERLDDFKLRLGTRNGAGAQKAVDGLIIADLIGLAQNKSISGALVVSGDADLTPGVIAAQGLGIRVHLLSMGSAGATSPYLKAEADRKTHWPDAVVRTFARAVPAAAIANIELEPAVVKAEAVVAGVVMKAEPAAVVAAVVAAVCEEVIREEQDIAGIAAEVFAKLDPQREVVVTEAGMLPRTLDAQLLGAGRAKLGRKLDEQERLTLRAEFKRLLSGRDEGKPAA